jgi:predicted SAM-dependent methyltransferase
MSIARINCIICYAKLTHFYKMLNMPIKLSCVEHNNNYLFEELSFSQCPNCNTIQLDKLIPLEILYSESHNYVSVGKVWDCYFNLFCSSIKSIVNNKKILEIGDPSGKIANRLDTYNKWYIIEPNKNMNICFNKNIEFISGFFDDNFSINENIDLIIHSHLFEHIYEPNKFLKKCYEILKFDGEMFFGVPNMEHIANNEICPFLGIFFEHNIFLNKDNITYLLKSNGFDIINVIDYENHSTLYHVKKSKLKNIDIIPIIDYKNLFIKTLEKYTHFINDINKLTNNIPIYIFGASYNTQILLTMGINIKKIFGIIDNSTDKHNKYFYGYNLQIYSPDILKDNNCIVILKNGYYSDEIKKQIMDINPQTNILC